MILIYYGHVTKDIKSSLCGLYFNLLLILFYFILVSYLVIGTFFCLRAINVTTSINIVIAIVDIVTTIIVDLRPLVTITIQFYTLLPLP